MAPYHRDQMGLLVGDGLMPIDPTPSRHRRQRSGARQLNRPVGAAHASVPAAGTSGTFATLAACLGRSLAEPARPSKYTQRSASGASRISP